MKTVWLCVLLLVAVVALVGCGSNNNGYDNGDELLPSGTEGQGGSRPPGELQEQTLRVALEGEMHHLSHSSRIAQNAARLLQQDMLEQGIYLHVDLYVYSRGVTGGPWYHWTWGYRGEDIADFDLIRLMPSSYAWHQMARSGQLLDFYHFIDTHPNLNRNDFFTDVLDSLLLDDGLYLFPLNWHMRFVGLNSNRNIIPPWLREQFNSHDGITVSQMMDMYLSMAARGHNPFAGHYLEFGLLPDYDMARFLIGPAVERYRHDVDRLAQHIDEVWQMLQTLGEPERWFYLPVSDRRLNRRYEGRLISDRFWGSHMDYGLVREHLWFFNFEREYLNVFSSVASMIEIVPPNFPGLTDFIPLLNDNGEIRAVTDRYMFAINAESDADLAWQFMMHFHAEQMRYTMVNLSPRIIIPTMNTNVDYYLQRMIAGTINRHYDGGQFSTHNYPLYVREGMIADAINRVENYLARPIYVERWIPGHIYEPAFRRVLEFQITPQDAAREILIMLDEWERYGRPGR